MSNIFAGFSRADRGGETEDIEGTGDIVTERIAAAAVPI